MFSRTTHVQRPACRCLALCQCLIVGVAATSPELPARDAPGVIIGSRRGGALAIKAVPPANAARMASIVLRMILFPFPSVLCIALQTNNAARASIRGLSALGNKPNVILRDRHLAPTGSFIVQTAQEISFLSETGSSSLARGP